MKHKALVILNVISRDIESKLGRDVNVSGEFDNKMEKDLEKGEGKIEAAMKIKEELEEIEGVADLLESQGKATEPRSTVAVDADIVFVVNTEGDGTYVGPPSAISVQIDIGAKRGRSAQRSRGVVGKQAKQAQQVREE